MRIDHLRRCHFTLIIDQDRIVAQQLFPHATMISPTTLLLNSDRQIVASFVGQRDDQRPTHDLILRWIQDAQSPASE